ncbi:hypothetical protein [Desulfocurvibacter africanus]|uniref:hypothetical protein n=1 Tax=Desulfocurvibacter africanus TaxID=873 RepID=UPI0004216C67|nr:hypothetical protein [Desulfocurvibacter africanus]
MTIKLFEPLIYADPEACVLEAYRHALFGGQAFIKRHLAEWLSAISSMELFCVSIWPRSDLSGASFG